MIIYSSNTTPIAAPFSCKSFYLDYLEHLDTRDLFINFMQALPPTAQQSSLEPNPQAGRLSWRVRPADEEEVAQILNLRFYIVDFKYHTWTSFLLALVSTTHWVKVGKIYWGAACQVSCQGLVVPLLIGCWTTTTTTTNTCREEFHSLCCFLLIAG